MSVIDHHYKYKSKTNLHILKVISPKSFCGSKTFRIFAGESVKQTKLYQMMKKNRFWSIALLTMLLSMTSIKAFAYDIAVENEDGVTIYYNYYNGTELEVTYGNSKYSDTVVIPEEVTYMNRTRKVTTIGMSAFHSCSALTNIDIPNSVTSIGDWAFTYCSGLTSVIIPNSVTTIGEYAFGYCSGLTSVIIPNSVFSIGRGAFSGASELVSITIPNSVATIERGAFSGTAWYNNQPDGLVYAGKVAYQYKGTMPENTCIELDEGTVCISSQAFAGCSNLTNIIIPNSVTSIGWGAFEGTGWYENQPDGLVYAGKVAYLYKGNMPENTIIELEDGTVGIASSAFQECYNLINIAIPNSVTTIGVVAFYGCSGLTSITIPNSVTTIGIQAFYGCRGLRDITIGNSVTNIGSQAFSGCRTLTSITIPHSVINIGEKCFEDCKDIKTVRLECAKVTRSLFYCLTSIAEVVLGNQVETIGENAFSGCKGITHLTLGKATTNIAARAFAGIDKLEDVVCYAKNVPETDRTAFENSYVQYATLSVPSGSIGAYKTTAPWSDFKQIVPAKDQTPEDAEKCATPTISYKNGQLAYSCKTEGVQFMSEIKDADIKSHFTSTISLTATYNISVYASKTGYKDSDVATATLCWIDSNPKSEGLENGVANIPAQAILIQSHNGQLTIEGAEEGTAISIYDTSGRMVGSVKATAETTTVSTSLNSGEVGIVKIGEKAVKVQIR
jgi:hypothetical protein